jgi:hypothetical protein
MSGTSGTHRFQDAIPAKAGTHAPTVRASDEWTPTFVGVVSPKGIAK